MKNLSVFDCSTIELPKIDHNSGNLTPVSFGNNFPFKIVRIFYSYEIPIDEVRGGHSHKECHQFLIAMSGSFDVELDDGRNKKIIHLDRPNFGIHIPPGIWSLQKKFSGGAICMVLASHNYEEKDYIRDYMQFIKSIK